MGIVATIKNMVVIEITVVVAETFKDFRKKVIIAVEEKTGIVIAKTFTTSSTASFNRRDKHI